MSRVRNLAYTTLIFRKQTPYRPTADIGQIEIPGVHQEGNAVADIASQVQRDEAEVWI